MWRQPASKLVCCCVSCSLQSEMCLSQRERSACEWRGGGMLGEGLILHILNINMKLTELGSREQQQNI